MAFSPFASLVESAATHLPKAIDICAAWLASLHEAGITSQQCELIEKYSLDTDDLQWLKGALAEIEDRQMGGR